MTPVFCDSSAFYAVIDVSETLHRSAAQAWEQLIRDDYHLVTSNYVVTETVAVVQARIGLQAVRAVVDCIEDVVEIAWIDEQLHQAALRDLFTHGRRHLSLVDCTSFALMRRFRIETVFSLDADFERHGFSLFRT